MLNVAADFGLIAAMLLVYAWEPGSHFGIYSPDTFYWQKGRR